MKAVRILGSYLILTAAVFWLAWAVRKMLSGLA
jgi:hypothetical protein